MLESPSVSDTTSNATPPAARPPGPDEFLHALSRQIEEVNDLGTRLRATLWADTWADPDRT
jgi:hypothetical protein